MPGPCTNAPRERLFGRRWGACPFAEMRDPAWQYAVERTHMAEVSPMTGWPDTYVWIASTAILGFRHARAMHIKRMADK